MNRFAQVTVASPLTIRIQGDSTDSVVDYVRGAPDTLTVGDLVEADIVGRLLIVSRLTRAS